MDRETRWTSEYWRDYWRDKSELMAGLTEASDDEIIAMLLTLSDDFDSSIMIEDPMVLERYVGPDGAKMARLKAWIVIDEDMIIDTRQVE